MRGGQWPAGTGCPVFRFILFVFFLLWVAGGSGCAWQTDSRAGGDNGSRGPDDRSGQTGWAQTSGGAAGQARELPPLTRADLDDWLSGFTDESDWTYGERARGELAGTWQADRGRVRVGFSADGTFRESAGDRIHEGLYAISANGWIAAVSQVPHQGPRLKSYFQFDGRSLTGPVGAHPRVNFRRVYK